VFLADASNGAARGPSAGAAGHLNLDLGGLDDVVFVGLLATAVREALESVLDTVERRRLPVSFPIEVRFAAPDDALLSTAYGRPTAYVAVHQYVGAPWAPYFRAVEEIMLDLDGRPHWGKRHEAPAAVLAPRYPEWGRFAAVRARLDPGGAFTNDHLARVLGPAGVRA